nr:hypothetical protein [Tanacetum cinerariifolium]
MVAKFEVQELEINRLKARVKLLEDREGVAAERSGDDASIKGRNLDKGRQQLRDGSIPTAGPPAAKVPTGSDVVLTANLIFTTATVVTTPYTRRKGKETMFSGRIVPLFDTMLVSQGERSGTPTKPHHTPSPKAQYTSYTTHSSPTLPPVTTAPIPTITPFDTPTLRQYTRRARIAQSSALLTVADEPASPLRDVSEGEGCPTNSGFGADQDRENIAKTSTLPHDLAPWVTTPAADEGSMQLKLDELTGLCTSLQRQHSEMVAKFEVQELEINREDQRMSEQVARDAEVARIHPEKELQMMINCLDMSNETVLKYLQEYEKFAEDLSIGERVELINNLIKYQENYAQILKFQTQQRKPWFKKQKRDYYMVVIRTNLGWKVKDFRGMTFKEIEAKFTTARRQLSQLPILYGLIKAFGQGGFEPVIGLSEGVSQHQATYNRQRDRALGRAKKVI